MAVARTVLLAGQIRTNGAARACRTWTALFLGLAQLERDLMSHISLKNNLLFPRASAR